MIIPVRCFTCGKVGLWSDYKCCSTLWQGLQSCLLVCRSLGTSGRATWIYFRQTTRSGTCLTATSSKCLAFLWQQASPEFCWPCLQQAVVLMRQTPPCPHYRHACAPDAASVHLCSQALDALGLSRYCCRRMLMTHVDLIEKLLLYNHLERASDRQ